MDRNEFPESSYESVRPYQTTEEQELKILHKEKRQESTAEVLKKANEIIQKSKNSKQQIANRAVDVQISQNANTTRDKSVDDIISQAKAQLKANAQLQTLRQQQQQQPYQVPAESSIQARGDTIHRLKGSKSQQSDDTTIEDYASICNVKIQQPNFQDNSNEKYNSIIEGTNQPIAYSTPNLNDVSKNTISHQEETQSQQDQQKIYSNNQNDQTEAQFIAQYSPQKLSVTPSKQHQSFTPSKQQTTQPQFTSASSKLQSNQTPTKEKQSESKIKAQRQLETSAQALASEYAKNQMSNQKMIKSQQKNDLSNSKVGQTNDATSNSAKKNNLIKQDITSFVGRKNESNVRIYTETEISQMRAILLRRKRERIRRNAGKIIYFHLKRYITAQQNKNRHDLMVEFIHHCAQMIQRAVRFFISQRNLKRRKSLIQAISAGWRIRRIIRLPQLIKIANDIKLMEQEKALFPDDIEGNQGIEEQLKREKINYSNSLRSLSVKGKWLTNLYPQNVNKIRLKIPFQHQNTSHLGQFQDRNQYQQNEQQYAGKYQQNQEDQFNRDISGNYEDQLNNSREFQNDKIRSQKNNTQNHNQIHQTRQSYQHESIRQSESNQQRMSPNDGNGLEYREDNVSFQNYSNNSQKSNGQQRMNIINRVSNFNSNMNQSNNANQNNNHNSNHANNNTQNFNHAWDDVPVGGNKQKKLNDTLKGWEDAYPAEQELDSNQRELVETKGKVVNVDTKQRKNIPTKRKQQSENEKPAKDFWDEQPIGGHTKKRMEQNWEEFPEEQSNTQIKTVVNRHKEEEITQKEQEEQIKRKEQKDESSLNTNSGSAPAGTKNQDKEKIDNLKKRTKYDPRKAIVEAKNKKQQNQDTSDNIKQQKNIPETIPGNVNNDEDQGEQIANEERDHQQNGDGRKQIKTTKSSKKQNKQDTNEINQPQAQIEGSEQQDKTDQQQQENKEQKQQNKKEFLKKKPKIIEFQKLNWKNVKSKTNTGRQELEQKTQLFQKQPPNTINQQQFQSTQQQLNSFQNQQQQLHYIDELISNNQGNFIQNHSEQQQQPQQQQVNQQYQQQQNQTNQVTRNIPAQNYNSVNTNNPDNYASNHNQFVAQEHFQQHQQPNHPNNRNSNNNVLTRQQQYLDQVHQKQIAQQQYPMPPKVFTEYLPNKTQVKAITQLAPNQPAHQEIIIRPALFKDRNTQMQQQQSQGLQHASNGYNDIPDIEVAIPQNYKSNGNATVSDLDRMRQNKKESLLNQQQQYQQHNQYSQDYQQKTSQNINNNHYQLDDYSSQQQQRQPQLQMQYRYPTQYKSAEMQSNNQGQRNGEYAVSHCSVPSNSTKQIQAILLKKQEQFMNYGFQ